MPRYCRSFFRGEGREPLVKRRLLQEKLGARFSGQRGLGEGRRLLCMRTGGCQVHHPVGIGAILLFIL